MPLDHIPFAVRIAPASGSNHGWATFGWKSTCSADPGRRRDPLRLGGIYFLRKRAPEEGRSYLLSRYWGPRRRSCFSSRPIPRYVFWRTPHNQRGRHPPVSAQQSFRSSRHRLLERPSSSFRSPRDEQHVTLRGIFKACTGNCRRSPRPLPAALPGCPVQPAPWVRCGCHLRDHGSRTGQRVKQRVVERSAPVTLSRLWACLTAS